MKGLPSKLKVGILHDALLSRTQYGESAISNLSAFPVL